MVNQTSVLVEQRVVAFALGRPGFGPARIAAELAQPRWGEIRLSTNGVWRVLHRHGLNTRAKRGWLFTTATREALRMRRLRGAEDPLAAGHEGSDPCRQRSAAGALAE
jgi:hypothetical protein